MLADDLTGDFSGVLVPAIVLVALFTCVAICRGINGLLSASFSSSLLKKLQTDFFAKTAQLPLNYFQRSSAGEFFTRFNHDVGQTQNFVANVLPGFIREAITATVLTGVLLWFCPWQLVAVATVLSVASVGLAVKCHHILKRYAVRQREGWKEINKQFNETIGGIDTIKTFDAEQRCSEAFQEKTGKFRSLSLRAGKTQALFSPLIDLATRISGLGVMILAYFLIIGNQLGLEIFILFFFCSTLLQGSISSMINLYTQMPQQLEGMKNLTHFFAEHSNSPADEPEITAVIDDPVAIDFKNLFFAYSDDHELYDGKNFHIPANQVTLIQGPNGSGKSTLINLLLRFNQPQQGEIFIGDKPIFSYSASELRSNISVVTQYHHIFNASLRDNLHIANPQASDADLLEVLEAVGMLEFQRRQSSGLDQILTSTSLSGGEKQRLCIAIMLLTRAPVLILDEPWSNLDDLACRTLARVLDKLSKRCTLVIIAHQTDRLQIQYDQVISLDDDAQTKAIGPSAVTSTSDSETPISDLHYRGITSWSGVKF